ncbi:MAG: trigger factor [Chlamydiales bacterium]|nr:trigger factor [Chlamydiales bacterium]
MNSQAPETKQFENSNVKIEAIIEPGCQVKLSVHVNKEFVSKSYQEALHRVKKEISLPGFRKGKAPDTLIITHYSKAVDNEWRDVLLNNTFHESLQITSYAPLKASAKSIKSHIKELKSSKDEASISYEFESVPVAPSIDHASLSLQDMPLEKIEKDAVHERIEEARLSLATWEDVQDRCVQEEDFVRLDLSEIKDGQEHPDFTDQRFQVTEKKMAPWLQALVIGMNSGDSKEGMSSPEEAFIDEEAKAAFKSSLFKVTVNKIEKPVLADLDDAFAKRLGVQTMDDVHHAIKQQLEHSAKTEQRHKQQKALEETLVSTYSFDLPKSLLEHDSNMLAQQEMNRLKQEGLSSDELSQKSTEIKEKALQDTKNRLMLYYLLRKYNAEHHVNVTNEDLNFELNKILQQFPKEMLPQIAKSLNEEIYTAILAEVVVKKGLEHLLTHLQQK